LIRDFHELPNNLNTERIMSSNKIINPSRTPTKRVNLNRTSIKSITPSRTPTKKTTPNRVGGERSNAERQRTRDVSYARKFKADIKFNINSQYEEGNGSTPIKNLDIHFHEYREDED
jgi:hypothetical protein